MNRFFAIALAAVAANVANLFVSNALVALVAGIGMIYLCIYGAIQIGLAVANGVMMITKNKTITENMNDGNKDYGTQNAKALTVGYGSVSMMVLLVALAMNGIGLAVGGAIVLGMLMFSVAVLGYKAKMFRDGKYNSKNNPNI